jgi:uncharacterized protein
MTHLPRRILPFLLLIMGVCAAARADEVIPPAPKAYVTDHAGVLSPQTVDALNQQLQQFEQDTSNQVVVAIYPHMQSNDDIAAYAVKVYRAWKIGLADKNRGNGVLLLVYAQDHKLRIATGYGLEGALPDFTCKKIIDNDITPRLRLGDYDGGVKAGVNAIITATKGENKGTGTTVGNGNQSDSPGPPVFFILIAVLVGFAILRALLASRSMAYSGNGSWWVWMLLNMAMNSSGSSRGGWSSGGGSWGGGSFGGGGFSGGGGSSGGGGASGSW